MMKSLLLVGAIVIATVSATNEAGLAFLAANKEKPGVVTLASGLQYKVLSAGSGTDHPLVSAPCECHYEGRTAANYPSGPVFDSSYARGQPSTFAPNQVIKGESGAVKHSGPATLTHAFDASRCPGWTEAMQLMVEGDKWELYIPSDLAYGDRGRPPKIGGGDCLIFTIEILKIMGGKKAKEEM
jgi:FKBP-type peptidyl-prolyl cis-trans isomerase FklB